MLFWSSKEDIPIIEIFFDTPHRKTIISAKKEKENDVEIPLFRENDIVPGKVKVSIEKGKSYKHLGILIELICNIEPDFDKCKTSEMFRIKQELESAGDIREDKIYQFSFDKFEKPFESYYGTRITLRYFLRVSMITPRFVSNIVHEKDFAIQLPAPQPERSRVVTMEGGIEDCLYIEHSYNKDNYHLKDCIVGQIYFSLIRIKIVRIELNIIRREMYMTGPNGQIEQTIIARIGLTDNCPRKGDTIPFQCYLGVFNLTPSFRNHMVSVKYYINMVLIDDEERRYPQRTEIGLWRKA